MTGVEFVDRLLSRPLLDVIGSNVDSPPRLQRGRDRDLDKHFARLTLECGSKSEVVLLHAALTVLIRRQIALEAALGHFRRLWDEVPEILCERLDLRWLVSACDTIADHPAQQIDGIRALLASTLANTVKLYETERRALGYPEMTSELAADAKRNDNPGLLFDGMTRFGVSYGDMIANLVKRLSAANGNRADCVQRLTIEVINRVLVGPTVYDRFLRLHTQNATRWSTIPT